MPIKRELKEKWLKALQSGAYEQTSTVLWRRTKYPENGKKNMCCLGVLADITNTWDKGAPGRVGGNSTLPPAGFHDLTAGELTMLSGLNDRYGRYPIEEIALLKEED